MFRFALQKFGRILNFMEVSYQHPFIDQGEAWRTSVNLYGMLLYVKFHLKCIFKFILQWRYLTEKTLNARTQLNSTQQRISDAGV